MRNLIKRILIVEPVPEVAGDIFFLFHLERGRLLRRLNRRKL